MHDLFLGLAFIAMVAAPAMVATLGGKKESQPEAEEQPVRRQQRPRRAAFAKAAALPEAKAEPKEPTGQVIRPHSMYFGKMSPAAAAAAFATPTLPIHGRGMMGR